MRRSIAAAALLVLSACEETAEVTDGEYVTDEGTEYAGETYSEFDQRREELESQRGSYAGGKSPVSSLPS